MVSDEQLRLLTRAVESETAGEADLRAVGPVRRNGPTGLSLALVERRNGDAWDVTFWADPTDLETLLTAAPDDAGLRTFAKIMAANLVEWWFTRGRPDHNRSVTGTSVARRGSGQP